MEPSVYFHKQSTRLFNEATNGPRMRPLVLLTALLTLAAPLAGCIAPPGQDQADASTSNAPRDDRSSPAPQTKTVSGTVGGSESKTETLRVPPGADALVVHASWSVGGSASFKLYDPAGKVAEEATASGGSARGGGEWYRADNPTPGDWTFKVSASGGVTYRFDFTY